MEGRGYKNIAEIINYQIILIFNYQHINKIADCSRTFFYSLAHLRLIYAYRLFIVGSRFADFLYVTLLHDHPVLSRGTPSITRARVFTSRFRPSKQLPVIKVIAAKAEDSLP